MTLSAASSFSLAIETRRCGPKLPIYAPDYEEVIPRLWRINLVGELL
jgi:hypothetical protein